ncbi:hypothetical protein Trydic_g708 [Trypoxylus dichotomus]
MLTDIHKTKRLGSCLKFLSRYNVEGDEFLNGIVTGDETEVCHITREARQQSIEQTNNPPKGKHSKQRYQHEKSCALCSVAGRVLCLLGFFTEENPSMRNDTV